MSWLCKKQSIELEAEFIAICRKYFYLLTSIIKGEVLWCDVLDNLLFHNKETIKYFQYKGLVI